MDSSEDLFNEAVRHHRSGHLPQAESLYQQVLQADPAHAHATHLLGILARQTGTPQVALSLLLRAAALAPTAPGFQFNLGLVQKDLGQFADAERSFRNELLTHPRHVEVIINLGIVLVDQGRLTEACACYRQALRLHPDNADAHNNLGIALVLQKQPADAIACFREAVRLGPANAHYYVNLANILKDQGDLTNAVACYRQALRLNPGHATTHNNLGLALLAQGEHGEALTCFRQALLINPDYANALNNLGIVLFERDEPGAAIACFRRAVAANPEHSDAYLNLAGALVVEGQLDEANECYRHLLTSDPGNSKARWNRSHLRLLQEDFAGGWADYEERWAQPDAVPRRFQQPRWDGAPLAGQTILVYAEQLLGDTMQFVRYLPAVKERGGTVLFECQPALVTTSRTSATIAADNHALFANLTGADQVFAAGTPLPPFDVHIPLLSLPGLFGTTPATIPAPVPYLSADPALVEYWRRALDSQTSTPRENEPGDITRTLNIGVVWQGSLSHKGDRRSLPLAHFEPLAHIAGARLVSLQVGRGRDQLVAAKFPVLDLGGRFDPNSLDDLAAALHNVDLVVTIDTAVAHLAGALGVPAWVALPRAACWRWLLDRADSPWYPTLRLFRQRRHGDWTEVFERIAEGLREKIAFAWPP